MESFDWSSYFSQRLLGVPTPPVTDYYINMVLRPHGAQRHLIQVMARTEFAVRKVMRFLLAAEDMILLTHRHNTGLKLQYQDILPVSAEMQQVIDGKRIPGFV